MSERFKGQRVLVTGAASGIGAAIARRLSEQGAVVACLDLRPNRQLACSVVADLAAPASLQSGLAQVEARLGMPDLLVHAAATQVRAGCVDTDPARFADIYKVNVIGAVRLMHWCVPSMRARGGGTLLMLSSINASFAAPTLAAYAASKAALESLARSAALEFAADGIRINAISPASIDTPLLHDSYALSGKAALAANRKRHPIERFGDPDEVADLALYLLSDRAAWITGAVYPIDGGARVTRR